MASKSIPNEIKQQVEDIVKRFNEAEIRMDRLRQREHERYGDRITPGGDLYEKSQEFLDWAASYDTGGLDIRSRRLHEQWLTTLPCPIIFMEGEYDIEEQLDMIMAEIQQ